MQYLKKKIVGIAIKFAESPSVWWTKLIIFPLHKNALLSNSNGTKHKISTCIFMEPKRYEIITNCLRPQSYMYVGY